MKPAIKWVDDVMKRDPSMPSELLNLVQEVRAEALDAVELFVRQQGTFAEGSNAGANQKNLIEQLEYWRRQ